jgi:hypothetical protein
MSIVTMNMSGYEIERCDSTTSEVICCGQAPALALQTYTESLNAMPLSMVSVDAALFLKKMYACQR